MNEDNTQTDVPSALFAQLHPTLAALETAMGAYQEALKQAKNTYQTVSRALDKVDPTNWSAKIEAARGSEDELKRIRILYDEEALTFMSTWLQWEDHRSVRMSCRSTLSDCIGAALKLHEGAKTNARDLWLNPYIESRLILARRIHTSRAVEHCEIHAQDAFLKRMQSIQAAAFKVLRTELPNLCRPPIYSTALVIPGKSIQHHLHETVDLRAVYRVRMVKEANYDFPASDRLAALLEECEQVMSQALNEEGAFAHDQNGCINERQHAVRMLDFLHMTDKENAPYSYSCCGTLDQQIAAQNERRLNYEIHRLKLQIICGNARKLLEQVVQTLKEAVAETNQLLMKVEAAEAGTTTTALSISRATIDRNTVERYHTLRMMLNNCLAADVRLRRWAKQQLQIYQTLEQDLSKRAGNRALADAFTEVMKQYAYCLKD